MRPALPTLTERPVTLPPPPSSLTRRRKAVLFFAFAFAVMADPVSSVAYAIEAALRALGGHLNLLLPTMGLVIGLIALVTLNYWQLVRAFPEGGGSPEAAGRAFGQKWTFLPIGALVVDFALTIAISIAAAGSALIALAPALAPARIPIDLALIAAVAALTWFGHGGRLIFAAMTSLFIVASVPVLALGWLDPHQAHGAAPITDSASPALVAVILAFPVAMALATGTEAPATSIAQLGQLDNRGRRRFGRGTLAATIVIVGGLTMGLTALAVHLHVGIPSHDQTQISELARAATGSGNLFGFFQVTSGLLLIAAAASSFQAGPGLLKALARTGPRGQEGLLPRPLGRTNHHHTPVAAVGVYAAISAAILLAASGQEQELVLVYAVAVFVSFLAGLLAMAHLSHRRGSRWLTLTNLAGALGVAFTLIVNLERGYPLLALAGTALVAAVLYWRWVRAGRPAGIEAIEREAEAGIDTPMRHIAPHKTRARRWA
jgi:Amino acid permease